MREFLNRKKSLREIKSQYCPNEQPSESFRSKTNAIESPGPRWDQ